MKYWLMKSEPDAYSIDDLKKEGKAEWDGVRNFKARNYMKNEMKVGDKVLFYHSNANPPGVAGIAEVCSDPYPDPTQFDKKSKYYFPKSTKEKPYWWLVDVKFIRKLKNFVSLHDLKADKRFDGMLVVKRGMRLSIQPVDKKHFDLIVKLGK